MNTVINLRGTNGSGKTTVVVNLLAACKGTLRKRYGLLGPAQPEAVQVQGPSRLLTVLGPYPINGGDAIVGRAGVSGVIELVQKYREEGDVLFEALIISSMYGKVGKWLLQHPPVIVAVLDVTLDECREGLYKRQIVRAHGGRWCAFRGRPRGVAQKQEFHFKQTNRVALQMEKDGIRVEHVTREVAPMTIWGWLK
jgi:hypothetical protein